MKPPGCPTDIDTKNQNQNQQKQGHIVGHLRKGTIHCYMKTPQNKNRSKSNTQSNHLSWKKSQGIASRQVNTINNRKPNTKNSQQNANQKPVKAFELPPNIQEEIHIVTSALAKIRCCQRHP